ncbi:MAG: TIGR03088 family PEP-CTERM/XrtA system glycosyltransferase [Massilia sp.]
MEHAVPLIVHLVYRLDFGGLENLMVERINRIAPGAYRHAVVALTQSSDFAKKITRPDVQVHELHKQPGASLGTHLDLYKLLRRLRPTVLHGYNLAGVEYAPVALLAGVPVRINGAHGRDASDPDGTNPKHRMLRRLMIPFHDCMYGNSADLVKWNREFIGVPADKSRLLGNGIDSDKFHPAGAHKGDVPGFGPGCTVIGTVGRIQDVKDHSGLMDTFIALRTMLPQHAATLRLAIVGDGPLLPALRQKALDAGIADQVWLPGARTDIADILRSLDIFCMSSLAEGTPGSALEAMASGLPVVGTRVGGLPEVIDEGVTGALVPPANPQAMAAALAHYVEDAGLARLHGAAGRERILNRYNMPAMVAAYQSMYDTLCDRKTNLRKHVKPCVES